MTQLFTASDYATLHSLVFQPDYPGYKPNVVESPNGDGVKDVEKRYAHVSEKYLCKEATGFIDPEFFNVPKNYDRDVELMHYLTKAHDLAVQVAVSLGIPQPFWPVRKYSALRVLEYNATATTAPHTDFDLFTLMCYRNLPEYFKYLSPSYPASADTRVERLKTHNRATALNKQIHFGELMEEIDLTEEGVWLADKHEVVASGGPWQYSVVYFAIPNHDAVLSSGITVGKWLEERMSRSRYER